MNELGTVVLLLVVEDVRKVQDANNEVKAVNVEDLDEGEVGDVRVDGKCRSPAARYMLM